MIDTITIIILEKDASPMLLKRICINSMLKKSFEAEIDHKLSLITGIIKPSIKGTKQMTRTDLDLEELRTKRL